VLKRGESVKRGGGGRPPSCLLEQHVTGKKKRRKKKGGRNLFLTKKKGEAGKAMVKSQILAMPQPPGRKGRGKRQKAAKHFGH